MRIAGYKQSSTLDPLSCAEVGCISHWLLHNDSGEMCTHRPENHLAISFLLLLLLMSTLSYSVLCSKNNAFLPGLSNGPLSGALKLLSVTSFYTGHSSFNLCTWVEYWTEKEIHSQACLCLKALNKKRKRELHKSKNSGPKIKTGQHRPWHLTNDLIYDLCNNT